MAPRLKSTATVPIRCIERHPTKQTVQFAGVNINLSRIATSYEPPLDVGYLSRIFRGKQSPGLHTAEKVAEALGMDLQAFLDTLRESTNV